MARWSQRTRQQRRLTEIVSPPLRTWQKVRHNSLEFRFTQRVLGNFTPLVHKGLRRVHGYRVQEQAPLVNCYLAGSSSSNNSFAHSSSVRFRASSRSRAPHPAPRGTADGL